MSTNEKEQTIMIIDNSTGRKFKKIVLDEDSFVNQLDKIVERDYFPDLKRLKTNQQLIAPLATPSTPVGDDKSSKFDENVNLGEFLSKYTSEDNASFSEVIKETNKRHQEKYPWFYLDENEIKLQIESSLDLPSNGYEKVNKFDNVVTWPYRNKNSMMFNPDTHPMTIEEQIDASSKNKQQIAIENTRFRKRPLRKIVYKLNTNQTDVSSTVSSNESTETSGKKFVQYNYVSTGELVNLERKEFRLVESTPLIEPNELNTPLMTWGEIESTPLLIDNVSEEYESTPSSGRFKIPEMSVREQMALKLNDDFSKSKKQQINQSCSSKRWTPSPHLNSPRTPRLDQLSPAVQHFAQSKLRLNIKNDYKNLSSSFHHSSRSSPSPHRNIAASNIRSTDKSKSTRDNSIDSCNSTDNLLKLSSKND